MTVPVFVRKEQNAFYRLVHQAHHRRGLAWFFDLDGTLVHATPGVHTGVKRDHLLEGTLNLLHRQAGGALAVITGRPDIFTHALFARASFAVATEHGAVVRLPGASVPQVRGRARDFAEIRRQIETKLGNLPGVYVEDHKIASLTVQFTEAADPMALAARITAVAEQVANDPAFQDAQDPLIVVSAPVPGNCVVDILSRNAEKSSAVDYFMRQAAFAGKKPIFFGDSEGDRRAMDLCKSLGGYAVGIGPKAPACADIVLGSVREARAWLATISIKPPAPRMERGGPG